MSDGIWDEIMKSPLDPDPDERRGVYATFALLALAVVVGLFIGVMVGNGRSEPTAADSIETSTTTTTEPPPPDPVLPSGYAEASGVGLKPLAVFQRDQDLYVVVNSAIRSDMDRLETNQFHIAEWTLLGDGTEYTASRTIASDLAPGVQLVEFSGVAALPVSIPRLEARQATDMIVRSGCNGCAATSVDMADGEIRIDGLELPYSLPEPVFIPIGAGITLSLDSLEISNEWGYAEWHIVDENEARLRVTFTIVFEGTDDPATTETDATLLVPPSLRGINQQNPTGASPDPFTRSGSTSLDRVGEILSVDNQPSQITLRWSVEWQHPVGEPISLPLDNVIDLGSIG